VKLVDLRVGEVRPLGCVERLQFGVTGWNRLRPGSSLTLNV
jgi:hypothetical protein